MATVNRNHGPKQWFDTPSIRRCQDGMLHEGQLQLITWSYKPDDDAGSYEEATGFGAVIMDEESDFREHFEKDLKGDQKKLYDEWPQGFRWTCCGTPGGQKFGCDHHGRGSKPCTCDFCRMGKPISDKIYNKQVKSAHGMGLDLPRGPDPRSKQANTAVDELMRHLLGLDN